MKKINREPLQRLTLGRQSVDGVVRSEPPRDDRKNETGRVSGNQLLKQTEEYPRQGCSKCKSAKVERCRAGYGSRVGAPEPRE